MKNLINRFIEIVIQDNLDMVAIGNLRVEDEKSMVRCLVDPWNGNGTILQHTINTDGSWDEFGVVVGVVTIEDEDDNSIQVF